MRIKEKHTWLKHLDFMLVDILSLAICFVISYRIKFGDLSFIQKNEWHLYIVIIVLLNILITFFTNPYSGIFRRGYYQEVKWALILAIYNLLVTTVFFYLLKIGDVYSREMTIWMYLFYFILSLLLKYCWKKILQRFYSAERKSLFVICSADNIETTVNNVNSGDFILYDIKGIYTVDRYAKVAGIPTVTDDYVDFILNNNIEEVLIAVAPSKISKEDYERLSSNGINLNLSVDESVGFLSEDQSIQRIGVYPVLSVKRFSFSESQITYIRIKRVLDIIISLFGLVFLGPVSLFIKIAYLFSGDKEKIFYSQYRVGKNGREFKMLKFRTMVPNAEERLQELLNNEEYRKQLEENQKIVDDPRVTPLGRVLRRTSIDELPQLINVLKGDMSLVGPRPLVANELASHDGLILYQKVKPGITGWWGCNGRSNIEYRERLELEYYYVKNISFYLDVICVFRTFFAVFTRNGAQ
jgi:undecaprenyl-phosphate galactose phosphotransferase